MSPVRQDGSRHAALRSGQMPGGLSGAAPKRCLPGAITLTDAGRQRGCGSTTAAASPASCASSSARPARSRHPSDWAFGVRQREDLVWGACPGIREIGRRSKARSAAFSAAASMCATSMPVPAMAASPSCRHSTTLLQPAPPGNLLHALRHGSPISCSSPDPSRMRCVDPLKEAYEAMPEPRFVMAAGYLRRLRWHQRRRVCLRQRFGWRVARGHLRTGLPTEPSRHHPALCCCSRAHAAAGARRPT